MAARLGPFVIELGYRPKRSARFPPAATLPVASSLPLTAGLLGNLRPP